jgi:16S rRNA (cytidine1402-2'-O)-methyltransferase
MLYLVSTPIGNLEDITVRAVSVLKSVDAIFAEDTRKALILLGHYGIKKPLFSFHEHNKKIKTPQIITQLKNDKTIALITEAGTPGISDPGFYLARACIENNVAFTALPGPTAVINALVLSGLPTDTFLFLGFLSPKPGKRNRQLKEASGVKATLVIYESVHRILKTLADIKGHFTAKKIAVAKEMTKIHETCFRSTADTIVEEVSIQPLKGEYVIVIDNR